MDSKFLWIRWKNCLRKREKLKMINKTNKLIKIKLKERPKDKSKNLVLEMMSSQLIHKKRTQLTFKKETISILTIYKTYQILSLIRIKLVQITIDKTALK